MSEFGGFLIIGSHYELQYFDCVLDVLKWSSIFIIS